jgi:imidazolonepropionase
LRVLRNISWLYQCHAEGGQGEVHPIEDAALAWADGAIRWVGRAAAIPREYRDWPTEDAGGCLVVPGLIDCHTHLAFGGWRTDEFEAKLMGRSYLEIARAGGGILSTVARTRAAGSASLVERCLGFLRQMRALGVTTVEVKTGYGLSLEHELRILEVYRDVAAATPQAIVPTLLAAHTIPPEYRADRSGYVELVIREIIPAAAENGLARFCDVFVEDTAFTLAEAERILEAGKARGLAPKVHADQITSGGGAELAARVGAASADHLERISDPGIAALARRGVVAVSLPIAALYLDQRPLPARRLLEAGVPVAVATDFNPGSAPCFDLTLAMMLACTLQRMTPREVLKGVTQIAARAIGMESTAGSLEVGRRADFALIEAESVEHWLYHYRPGACRRVVVAGDG